MHSDSARPADRWAALRSGPARIGRERTAPTMPAPPPVEPTLRARRGYEPYAYTLYGVVLAFLLWRLPVVGNPASLDGAWQGLLQHDWTHDVRAGVGSV